jgi:Rab GDP dissociation inhibitor
MHEWMVQCHPGPKQGRWGMGLCSTRALNPHLTPTPPLSPPLHTHPQVLHLDRNSYYGGECASLNLTNLYKKFCKGEEPPQQFFDLLGNNRDYNVDLVPKFIMANGNLVKVLVKTDVTRYMDFKLIDGSYVYKKGSAIAKVPANEAEALKTGLLGLLQKNWLRGFLKYIAKYDQANPKTWDGMDFTQATMKQLYDKMWLDETAQEFLGHAMALEPDDSYLSRPASECVAKLRLYAESLDRYGKSPFIYPIYGLGNLPEGFSRLCAIHGGIFILNKGVDEVLYNGDGTAAGVRSGSGAEAEVALAPIIIGDPSYFPKDKVKQVGSVIRSICLLSKPVKGIEGDSGQIIIPQKQLGRKSGEYGRLLWAHAPSFSTLPSFFRASSQNTPTPPSLFTPHPP